MNRADVIDISVGGGPGQYTFSVTVQSPDTGCDQYADWWEVVTTEGELIYRRVLLHSHVGEQPFTRSGDPVDVGTTDTLIIRTHLNKGGYGGLALEGSVEQGFRQVQPPEDFAAAVPDQQPLPTDCAF